MNHYFWFCPDQRHQSNQFFPIWPLISLVVSQLGKLRQRHRQPPTSHPTPCPGTWKNPKLGKGPVSKKKSSFSELEKCPKDPAHLEKQGRRGCLA